MRSHSRRRSQLFALLGSTALVVIVGGLVGLAVLKASDTPAAGGDVRIAAGSGAPDYARGDWDLQDLRWGELRYASGPPPPIERTGPVDVNGIPLQRLRNGDGGALVYNPTVLATEGLRYLHGYRRTGDEAYLVRARDIARRLDEHAAVDSARWQLHRYERSDRTYGWVNANSQGLVLSFFSRFHRAAGGQEHLDKAAQLVRAFHHRPGDRRWLAMVDDRGNLWFEHWPDGEKKHVLNGHLNAVFGLYEYWRQTRSPEAELLLQGGIQTVRDQYDRFRRRGQLSVYGLTDDWASMHYHDVHIEQMRQLARITGDRWFSDKVDELKRDRAAWLASRSS